MSNKISDSNQEFKIKRCQKQSWLIKFEKQKGKSVLLSNRLSGSSFQPFRCWYFLLLCIRGVREGRGRIIKTHKMNKFQLRFSTLRFPGGFEVYGKLFCILCCRWVSNSMNFKFGDFKVSFFLLLLLLEVGGDAWPRLMEIIYCNGKHF